MKRWSAGLALLALLWLAAAWPAVSSAVDQIRQRSTADRIGHAVDGVVVGLQAERRMSATLRAGGDTAPLTAQRARTDRARTALDDARAGRLITADAARSVDELHRRLDGLGALRGRVDGGLALRADVVTGYSRIIEAGLGAPWLPSAQTLAALGRAREALAQEDALVTGALATTGVTDTDRLRVGALTGVRQASSAARYEQLETVERQLLLPKAGAAAITGAAWTAAADPAIADLRAAEARADQQMLAATPGSVAAIVYAGLIAGVGLIAVIGAFLFARRVTPEKAVPAAAAPPDTNPARQELLLDLHRRSQRLVHRQLRLLDTMERRQSDDETLGDLFRADNLATRIRRNVEKAITLAGGTPGRRWRRPMPLAEVARGAGAEIADYVRVSTGQVAPAGLAGSAITDVMHLLAELIDNATTYSPPDTRVRVGGVRDADGGYTFTITDVGPGMSELDLATAEEVMADEEPPADGVWWGFHAIGRFAARHDITVRLEAGAGGGLVATVVLPADLITDPGDDGPGPDAPPLSRVARMRARINEVSDATSTTVDLPVVGSRRNQ
ncbi:nitrate- and nitrite sensing domain-containing protein [Actinoplanes sp. NPDC026619]|uniref:sensor histidine kinase n=1 Tax=Actinoplanes sp. NPDC026619 TaxID=3155798 RepID=UPI003408301B